MSELLVRVHDKINTDFYLNCQCTKRFDVIVAQLDGWAWGREELTNPDWRILKIAALPLGIAESLCSSELHIDPLNPSRTLQKRAFKISLADVTVPQSVKNFVADDTRASPSFTVPWTLNQLQALVVRKPAIEDPNVLGASPAVIG